jgi:transcriptional regulator with XRE-family HTH domain
MKAWTKTARQKYAAHNDKAALAQICGVSRQSLSGYAHSEPGDKKAVRTPANVAERLSKILGVPARQFGQGGK